MDADVTDIPILNFDLVELKIQSQEEGVERHFISLGQCRGAQKLGYHLVILPAGVDNNKKMARPFLKVNVDVDYWKGARSYG